MINKITSFLRNISNDKFAIIAVTFLFYSITFSGALAVFNNIDLTGN